jgi:hypothetical protein
MGGNCFSAGTTHSVAFAWWVPVDHGNEIQGDSATFDLGFYTEQCRHNSADGGGGQQNGITTTTGSGFGKLSPQQNQNSGYGQDGENFDTPNAITSRARNGNGGWEVGIGSGDSPGDDTTDKSWSFPIQNASWSLSYATDGTTEFEVDGTTVSRTTNAGDFDGRLLVQTKADEATVDVQSVSLSLGGSSQSLSGPTSVTASNDDDGGDRDFQYLVINTALDGSQAFEVSGTLSVQKNDNFPDQEESWAVDVSAE